jgi:hypothetical protein
MDTSLLNFKKQVVNPAPASVQTKPLNYTPPIAIAAFGCDACADSWMQIYMMKQSVV